MYYGEAELQNKIDSSVDNRGVISREVADQLRRFRHAEEYQRYDTIVIGKGASRRDVGWFENWKDFGNSSDLQWFTGRASGVGTAYSSQTTERTDWAQDLVSTSVEFTCETYPAQYLENPLEADLVPIFFKQNLPDLLGLRVVLSDSDEIAKAPASHYPSRYGVHGAHYSSMGSPAVFAGNNGVPDSKASWRWPIPLLLAAKARITVVGRVDEPALDMLRKLPDPGVVLVPQDDGSLEESPIWYKIRITHSGPRYLQLRGGRSSS